MTDLRDDEDFAALLAAAGDVPVVIDFWAPWCVPCKTMTPLAEALAVDFAESTHFVKVDIDAAP
ncbi:thioredoxin family protein, partial [Salmonella enterica]